jgi:acyl-coenzyme A thioesterase PaaI-like protein
LIKAGRSVARADIEVKDAQGRLIAIGRGSFSTVAS